MNPVEMISRSFNRLHDCTYTCI